MTTIQNFGIAELFSNPNYHGYFRWLEIQVRDRFSDERIIENFKLIESNWTEGEYMSRVATMYNKLDSLKRTRALVIPPSKVSSDEKGRFLIKHDNALLFKGLLPYVKHSGSNQDVATFRKIGNYKFFILHNFLLQFAVVAMFIFIFVQLMFEEKNITE